MLYFTWFIKKDCLLLLQKNAIKRDWSDHQNTDYYRDPDEKEQLIEDDDDVVHFSATSGFQIDSFKDNLEYHLGTIKSTLGNSN